MHKFKSKLVSEKRFADQLSQDNSKDLLLKSDPKIVSKKEEIIKQSNRAYAISEMQKEMVAKSDEKYTPDPSDSFSFEINNQTEFLKDTSENKQQRFEISDSFYEDTHKQYQINELKKELVEPEKSVIDIQTEIYTETKDSVLPNNLKSSSTHTEVFNSTDKIRKSQIREEQKELVKKTNEKKQFHKVEKNYLVKEEYKKQYQVESIKKRAEEKTKLLDKQSNGAYGITKSENESQDPITDSKLGFNDRKILYTDSEKRNNLSNVSRLAENNGVNDRTAIKGVHQTGNGKNDSVTKEADRKAVANVHKTEHKKHESVHQTNGSKSSCKKEKKDSSTNSKSKSLLRFVKNYTITTILKSDKENENDQEIKTGGKNMLYFASRVVGKGISKLFMAIMGGSTAAIILLMVLILLILLMVTGGASSSSTIGVSNSVLGSLISDDSQLAEFKSNPNYVGNILGEKFAQYTSILEQWVAKSFAQTVITDYNPDGSPIQHTETVNYTVNFVNHGTEIDNSADILSIYLSIINDETNYANITAEGGDQTNMPYLIADTPKEIDLLNTLFSQMNYTVENDKELQVHQLTGEEWIAQYGLTENQKKYYEIIKPNVSNLLEGLNALSTIQDIPNIQYDSEHAKQMMSVANSCLGIPYVWGGSSPATGMDCSGFACYVYNQCGYNVGRTTAQGLYNMSNNFSDVSQAQPGDLVFYGTPNNIHHVAIYAGDGMMIEAPHKGTVIKYSSIQRSDLCGFGRM